MFHVYDDVIVAGMASNFGENRGEAAEEESIESFAFLETGFDGIAKVAGCHAWMVCRACVREKARGVREVEEVGDIKVRTFSCFMQG